MVVRKTTKSGPLMTVARMAVAMMRTMEEAIRAVRLMRDNGDDDGGDFSHCGHSAVSSPALTSHNVREPVAAS